MTKYFNREGTTIPLEEWAEHFEDEEYRNVRTTPLPIGWTVSTVWNGIDFGWGRGPPLIFETLLLSGEDHLDHEVYKTLQEAIEGHEKMVKATYRLAASR